MTDIKNQRMNQIVDEFKEIQTATDFGADTVTALMIVERLDALTMRLEIIMDVLRKRL